MAGTFGITKLEAALRDLGGRLAELGEPTELFVIGGAAFLLSDPTTAPPTRDLDAAARIAGFDVATPVLTPRVIDAIAEVGRIHQLGPGWINAAAANSFDNLVPEGALQRAEVRTYDALTLRIASRLDLIRLKFQASIRPGRAGDRHRHNLVSLGPTDEELDAAAAWYLTTTSDRAAFEERVARVLELVRENRDGR